MHEYEDPATGELGRVTVQIVELEEPKNVPVIGKFIPAEKVAVDGLGEIV